jgi:hypothetical protein
LLKEKTYKAVVVLDGKKPVGRVVWTKHEHKQFPEKGLCGFFSHFECVDNQKVADLIMRAVADDLKKDGITYLEGTYFPFDQDNRRGVLIEGFEYPPLILTSYNPKYYGALLENFGMKKAFDTIGYKMPMEEIPIARYGKVDQMAQKRYGYHVESADFSKLDKLIAEVSDVMKASTTDYNYQDAPSPEQLEAIVRQWRSFLQPRYIKVARKNEDGKMIGVVVAIPDFNQVFKKMKGSINPVGLIRMLYWKKRITLVRGMLQFVLPEYHGLGVSLALYISLFHEAEKDKVTMIEAGTMMENNTKPNAAIQSAGGKLYKRYRIYGLAL